MDSPTARLIACRSQADFAKCAASPPPTAVLRNCAQCQQPVYLSEAGQKQEKAVGPVTAIILCNPCALVQLTLLDKTRTTVQVELNPVAAAQAEHSESAKANLNRILDAVNHPQVGGKLRP